jgi:hypothetical protein
MCRCEEHGTCEIFELFVLLGSGQRSSVSLGRTYGFQSPVRYPYNNPFDPLDRPQPKPVPGMMRTGMYV